MLHLSIAKRFSFEVLVLLKMEEILAELTTASASEVFQRKLVISRVKGCHNSVFCICNTDKRFGSFPDWTWY